MEWKVKTNVEHDDAQANYLTVSSELFFNLKSLKQQTQRHVWLETIWSKIINNKYVSGSQTLEARLQHLIHSKT